MKKQRFVQYRRCRVSCTWGASKTVRGFRNSPSPTFRSRPAGEQYRVAGRTGYVCFWGWPRADRAKIALSNGRRCASPRHKRSSLINRTHGALSIRPRTLRASYRAEIISHRTPLRIADRLPPSSHAHYPTRVFLPVFVTNGKQTQFRHDPGY